MSAPRFAVLGPHAATYVLDRLRRAGVTSARVRGDVLWRRSNGFVAQAEELDAGWRQLVEAAKAHAADQAGEVAGGGDVRVSVVASGTGSDRAEVAAGAGVSEWIGTREAAAILGVTDRRVRQHLGCGVVAGRQVSPRGSWSVERASVESLAMMRKAKSA